jgi:hypothetical protein
MGCRRSRLSGKTLGTSPMADQGATFYFRQQEVGRFRGSPPHEPGRHPYEPFRGTGHLALQQLLQAGRPASCHYELGSERVHFRVTACPEYGVLELCDFEVTPRGGA